LDRATKLKRELDAIDWEAFTPVLIAVAINHSKRYRWNSGGADLLGEGNTPQDIAQRVIQKAYSGKRSKPPDMDVKQWLVGQIRSEISNLFEKHSHQKEFSVLPSWDDEDEEDLQDHYEHNSIPDGIFSQSAPLTPEQEILKKEYIKQRSDAIFGATKGDPELEELVEAILRIGTKPKELAEVLNKPVTDIYNLLRRLQRRVESRMKND
jgi:DNA-directed RNA polymerase specialized sigma24 family protein